MICHKCGAILPDNSIRCSHCGIRVSMTCPECKTVVPFGERFCSHCGFELLIICHNCNSANVYSAKECRKCHTPLINTQEKDNSIPLRNKAQFQIEPKIETQYSDVKIDSNEDIQLTYKDVDISNPTIEGVIGDLEQSAIQKDEDIDFDNLIENINKKDANEINEDTTAIADSGNDANISKIDYKKDDDNKIIDDVVKYQRTNNLKNKKPHSDKAHLENRNIKNNRTKEKTEQEIKTKPNVSFEKELRESTQNTEKQVHKQIPNVSFEEGFQEYTPDAINQVPEQNQAVSFEEEFQEFTPLTTNQAIEPNQAVPFDEGFQEFTPVATNQAVEQIQEASFEEGFQEFTPIATNQALEQSQAVPFDDGFQEYTPVAKNQAVEQIQEASFEEGFQEFTPVATNQSVEQIQEASFKEGFQEYTQSPTPQEIEPTQSAPINEETKEDSVNPDEQKVQQNNDIPETNEIVEAPVSTQDNELTVPAEEKITEKEQINEPVNDVNSKQNDELPTKNKKINEKSNQPPKRKSIIPSKYNKEILNKPVVIDVLTKIKKSIKKHVIALNGPEGCGKSAVIRQVKEILSADRYMTLYGSCSPLSQITSYGFLQDAFLRLLGFPPYRSNNLEAFMRDFNRSQFKRAFNFLKPQELSLFLNFLYPTEPDKFENILENKQLMFTVFEKILKAFLTNTNMVIIIDNFDLLDGASYDFINYILGKNFFNSRLKLLVAYQDEKPIQSFFDKVKYDIFENITLNKFTDEELKNILKMTIGIDVKEIEPETYLDDVIARADGNAIRLEQDIAFLFDINNMYIAGNKILIHPENKPEQPLMSVEELIKFRVNFLPAPVKNILFMAAILGYRFATDVICQAATSELKDTIDIINLLRNELFIVHVDDFTCEFKNLAIWKLIYKEAQSDLLFKENSEKLYEVLKSRVLSSNIQKLISCSEALDKREEFAIWQNTAEITAKLGDTNLFVIAQKQCLKILEEIDMPNADNVRVIIYEQIGKLLSKKSPLEAINYLSNVLESRIKKKNTNKIVDVSGYFINSCYLTGNYFGVVEAVDAVVKHLQNLGIDLGTQIELIKTRELKALINIGNTEQLINLIKENLLIKINQELTSKQLDVSYKNLLMDIWFDANIILAKAYALQGNIEVFATTEYIKEVIKNNNVQNPILEAKVTLIEALAHSLVGETSISNEILTSIQNDKNIKIVDKKLLCEWNLINVINRLYENDIDGIKTDLFELAEFSNNINEHATKHLIKLFLGYVFKEEGDSTKAMTIYNEEITYFSKEKMAIGAMLAWALIAKASVDTGSLDLALTTATKAYDVSQSPRINNAFFGIYFQKLIAEIYLLRNDLLAVKMYLEKALTMAESNNIKFLCAYIYIDYGKYMEENMKSKQSYEKEQIQTTLDYYEKALNIARELGNKCIKEKAVKARASFKTFCQLSGINLS